MSTDDARLHGTDLSGASTRSAGAAANTLYHERLWPAWWVWLVAVIIGLGFGIIGTRVSVVVSVSMLTVVGGGLLAALWWSTPEVAVRDGELIAGRAHIPLTLLGSAQALDDAEFRHAVGPGLNARAYLCIRGWIPTGVQVQVVDPADSTPYWLISSRRPRALAAAIGPAE